MELRNDAGAVELEVGEILPSSLIELHRGRGLLSPGRATEVRTGASGDGPPIDLLNNIKIFPLGSAPEVKILVDDFEIRD